MGLGIRTAGHALRNFDDAYAQRVRNIIHPNPDDGNTMRGLAAIYGGGSPVNKPVMEFSDTDSLVTKILGTGAAYGAPAMGAAVRYGLPATGLTAAGLGLAELIQLYQAQLEQQAQQEQLLGIVQ